MRNVMIPAALALLLASSALAGTTPEQICWAAKNKLAGHYEYCRQKAESKFASTGDFAGRTAALQKCVDTYAAKWPGTENKAVAAGGACPSVGDQSAIQYVIDYTTTNITMALAGGVLRTEGQLLRTGQVSCYDPAGTETGIFCAGTGQDGELQMGLTRTYVDNGDGTITDTRTGLMWEKLSDDGSIHDKDSTYTWANAFATKVAGLNGGGGFAGHSDWRVPNVNELQSLVSYGAVYPAIDAAFNTSCAASCTVLTCSCTQPQSYWSSSTYQDAPSHAWFVVFNDGVVDAFSKTNGIYVRAVRGGS